MPEFSFADLTSSHAARLDWFRQGAGSTTGYPEPLPDGSFLVTRPKGIYKPQDLEHALSIRIHLNSPYPDGEVYWRPDGTWHFAYHQENADPALRDSAYTNRALLRCIEDRIAVGVLRERVPDKQSPDKYEILGLAVPTGWDAGYFFFEGVRSDGTWHRGDTLGDVLVAQAEELDGQEASTQEDPQDDYDARLKVTRQIVARRGQPKFRSALLDAYSRQCAVTGTQAVAVLEAAHIRPYRGPQSNTVDNGLLLRADIHTLFDLSLLAVDPSSMKVAVSKTLADTTYGDLHGKSLSTPTDETAQPSLPALTTVWDRFVEAEQAR